VRVLVSMAAGELWDWLTLYHQPLHSW